MKKLAYFQLVVILFAANISYSQAPDWTRVLQTNTYGVQFINAITADASNVYFAAGISGPVTYGGISFTSIGYRDLIISKTTAAGVYVWTKQINAQTNGTIFANEIKVDGSGNIYIIGSINGTTTIGSSTITSSATCNSFYAKFDAAGNGIWATPFLSTGSGASRIAFDSSVNSYIISSTTKLIKISSAGVLQWEQSYPDRTLQAVAVYGTNLYLGGALSGTTMFGTLQLNMVGGYNTGYLVKSDLNGTYSASMVVGGSTTADGSTVTDIALDATGNLIITGIYTANLTLGTITIPNSAQSGKNYTYIAKCNSSFSFLWAKSSTVFNNSGRVIFGYRLFSDSGNNIYEYGPINTALSYSTVSSTSNYFLFKFDASGNALNSYDLNTLPIFNRLIVSSGGQIITGSSLNYSGSSSYGDLQLNQYNNSLTWQWQLSSLNNSSGTIKINFVKHDAAGNTYLQSTVLGNCNYFGTLISTNTNVTVISKHNVAGTLLWMNQISDISPNLLGPSFILDKDNNVLTVGLFQTSIQVGTTTLTSTNTGYDGYVAKYSSSGSFLWASKMNLGVSVTINITVASDNSGNVLASGVSSTSNYLVKFDASGTQLWAKIFSMESYYNSLITTDASNNIYLTSEIHISDKAGGSGSATIGTVTLNQTFNDGSTALVKFDSNGNALWAKTYGGVTGATYSDGWPCDIRTDAAGNSYLWGWCRNNSIFGTTTLVNPFATNQDYSYYIAKINTSGDVVWAKAIYETKYAFNYGDVLDLDNLGNIYVGGHFKDVINIDGNQFSPVGTNDFFVAKYSNAGTYQWINTIPANSNIINSLSVFGNNVLSVVGNAGINSTIGTYTINAKGGSNVIVATLGNLSSLSVSSFTPTSGPIGTAVTISGTNFSTTPANNIVWFGAVKALVTAATSTTLSVTVPTGATYQPITVTVDGLTASTSKPFNVTFPSSGVVDINAFSTKIDIATGSQPYFAATGDIDGDGKPDLVVANNTTGSISVYRNTSTSGTIAASSFAAKVDFTTGSSPWGIAIGDLDGDGKLDIVVPNRYGNTISVFRNTSTSGSITTSSFATKVDFPAGSEAISVAIGDVDGDNKLDIVVANYGSNSASIYRNIGAVGTITSASFAAKVDFTAGSSPIGVSIGDLDSDGKLDLVVVNAAANSISILRNTSTVGTPSFAGKVDFTVGTSPYYVAIGDLDGDNKPDMVTSNAGSDNISVFRNTSTSGTITSGSFATKVDLTTGSYPYCIAIGDVDGDGKQDLAVSNYNSNTVSVFKNNSSSGSITVSSFATKVDYPTGVQSRGLAIVDIDGDGKPDIASTNSVGNTFSVFRNTLATVILPPTITSFTPTSGPIGTTVTITGTNFSTTPANNIVWFGAVKATVSAATATSLSVNVPVGATFQPISVTVNGLTTYSNSPFNITFSGSGTLDVNSLTQKVDISVGTGTNPYSVAIGDLDGDGKPDLAVLNFTINKLSIYRNISTTGAISSSSFDSKVDFTTGTQPDGIAIGDIDGDGKPDIAVANYGSNTISVYQNNSSSGSITSSSFASKIDFPAGISPTSIAIGDIDLDGKPDIVSTNGGGANVSIFKNTGTVGSISSTSFATKVDFGTGGGPSGISIGDIDGDGKPDLAISNYGGSASILRNTCTTGSITSSSFATNVDFATGTNPRDIALGDIDGDGKLDVAISNEGSNTVSVFRNASTSGAFTAGSFATKVDFPTGTGPWGVSFGDINGDSKIELIVTNNGGASISIFKNNSSSGSITSGSFAPKVDFTSGANPYNIAVGDLDGDGKPDLVSANNTGNSISVFRNLITSSATLPTISSFTPSSGIVGTSVTINGTNFGSSQGTSTVKFGTTTATPTSWSDTQIIATVPAITAAAYTISVTTTAGIANSSTQFTVNPSTAPAITSFTPSSGLVGSSVTILGTNFGATQGTSTVKFGTATAAITSWGSNQIIVIVPTLTTGVYTISVTTIYGVANSSTQYTVTTSTSPTITSFSPSSGLVGSSVTINGTNFGSTQGTSTVKFGTTTATVNAWSTIQLTVTVPVLAAGSYAISVTTTAGVANTGPQYTVTTSTSPTITSVNPSSGMVGTIVTIAGTNFGTTQGTSSVKFGTTTATPSSWGATQIVVPVPALALGPYIISVTTSNGSVNGITQFMVTNQQCAIPTVRKKGSLNILVCQTANASSYQWYLNDVAISGATKQFYVARKAYGNYSVQVTLSNGCSDRSIATSVTSGGSIAVYPNPGDKLFNVELNLDEMGSASIKLINGFGIVKRIVNFNKDMIIQTIPVEVDDLEQGVYIIDVEVNGVKIESQKVVIL